MLLVCLVCSSASVLAMLSGFKNTFPVLYWSSQTFVSLSRLHVKNVLSLKAFGDQLMEPMLVSASQSFINRHFVNVSRSVYIVYLIPSSQLCLSSMPYAVLSAVSLWYAIHPPLSCVSLVCQTYWAPIPHQKHSKGTG